MKISSLLKLIFGIVFFALCLSACGKVYLGPADEDGNLLNDQALPYHNEDWMGDLADSLYLTEITIPGTHDTGADKHTSQVSSPIWHDVICQDFCISNQLKLGMRWLDVRLNCDSNGDLTVHHSSYYLHKNFNDVIDYALDFLKDHPKEVVVFMIKQEHSSVSDSDFGEAVYDHIKDHGLQNFYLEDKVPTLGEVRGKVFVVRRFVNETGKDFGIYFYWPDNTKGNMYDHDGFSVYAQDHYSLHTVTTDTKYNEVVDCLERAHGESGHDTFYLNFVSGERVPGETLWKTADDINGRVEDYLDGQAQDWHRCGIIMINFAGGGDVDGGTRNCAEHLAEKILQKNP